MPVESAADRAAFFDPEEFGDTATYQPAVGSPVSIDGIYDDGFAEIDTLVEAGAASTAPTFLCPTSALPAGAAEDAGDTLTVNGLAHTVLHFENDGTGMTLVRLHKSI